MSYENVLTEIRDGVLWLTLNRPEKLNALNRATLGEISDVFESVGDDDDVWAVVVTGAGEKAFVAGADIGELNTLGPVEAKEFALRGQAIFRRIECLTKPVVAAVNGFALGGGCELAMACHLRVATSNAVFGQPEVKLGLIPGYAGTQRLCRIVGRGVAMELVLTGRIIDADEALRIGLVTKVVPAEELTAAAEKLAKTLKGKGPLALRAAMEVINQGYDLGFDDACRLEANMFGVLCATEDMKEGTGAFLEKRKPDFKGK